MKRSRMGLSALALVSVSALALAGCSSADDADAPAVEDNSAIISTNGSEPQNPLIPTNTTETGGGKIATSIFAGLVSYTATGEIENEVAKSIESDDATTWTVTLNDGWTFTDGEEVTSSSFVDAWNYGALNTNAQGASYFFDDMVGFADVQNTKDDPTGAVDEETGEPLQVPDPLSETLSGLKVVDDTTFTVELSSPEADWPLRLGYTAFMPLPSAAYDDIAAFGENPVGNGPYMLDGEGAWVHEEGISLVTNPDYDGVRKPVNGGLEITFYNDQAAAYADVQGGNLDVLDAVPDSAFETYEAEFGDRAVNQAAAIFQGFRTPATDFTSPVIDGYSDSLDGAEVLEYNPKEAVKLWAEADAIAPYGDTTFDIAYNSDGGHQAWVDAVINSIVNTLDISATGKPYPTFAAALDDRANDALTGGTRAGWQGDYPSLYNFLAPLYQTGAGSNYEDYTSEEFDALLKEGAAAETVEDATAKYQAAQEVLLKDLPSIPLWYSNVNGVSGDTVDNVVFGWDSVPLYYQITKG